MSEATRREFLQAGAAAAMGSVTAPLLVAQEKPAAKAKAKAKPAELLPMYAPPAKPASAQGVGRYAIQFTWLDGHSAGIYSWDYLRRHCQCQECTFAESEPAGAPN